MRDRQIVLEKVLTNQGIDAATLIESYVPDPGRAVRYRQQDLEGFLNEGAATSTSSY